MIWKLGTVPMLAVSALVVAAMVPTGGSATEQFIPKGFTYAPGSEQLPPLNSPQDRIEAGADVRETEIWMGKHEERVFREQLDRFQDHDFDSPTDVYSRW